MSALAEQVVSNEFALKLDQQFPGTSLYTQQTVDKIPTIWIERSRLREIIRFVKTSGFEMLFDLCGVDERQREHRNGLPTADFTIVYHFLSFRDGTELRLKVGVSISDANVPSIHDIYPNANWYEREAWDMFGVTFTNHPSLYRILLPSTWEGHALRKDHPARATEMEPFHMDFERQDKEQEALRFKPEEWGMTRRDENTEFMFLNLGPNHPSVHGVFRIVLQLDGEVIVDAVPEIGYHHPPQQKYYYPVHQVNFDEYAWNCQADSAMVWP